MPSARFIACLIAISLLGCSDPPPSDPPNILFIISDDQAWNDYGFMGHPYIQTPRIDELARQARTYTRGYVAAPLCSPSLATIITGLYPHQHGIVGNDPAFAFDGPRYREGWMQERYRRFAPAIERFNDLPLLTQRLDALDYRSLQTGKWWMGSWRDAHFSQGMTHGDPARGGRHGDEGLTIGRDGLEPIYDFVDQADSLDQPFFIWYAPFLPHTPHNPPDSLLNRYLEVAPSPAVARYWAMCTWFDQSVGALMDFLEARELDEETLVVYIADNGWIQDPDRPNRYAPRSKRTPFEGGIRSPLMLRWPGRIAPALDSTTLVSAIDLMPTALAAAGLPPDTTLPGLNLLDPMAPESRDAIFAEAFDHDIADLREPAQSLQYRIALDFPWKLILPYPANLPDEPAVLYDLAADPHETQNLIEQHPERVEQLIRQLDAWWSPGPNQ